MSADPTAPKLADPLDELLGYQLRRASSVMLAHLGAALAPTALRPAEATILLLMGANLGCTQSYIGRVLGIKRANMVPLIAGLVKSGLVERSPVDGRSQALYVTELGNVRLEAVRSIIHAHEARFQGLFEAPLRDALLEALRTIRAAEDPN